MATSDQKKYGVWVVVALGVVLVAVLGFALFLLFARGGGDEGDKNAQQWATDVCESANTWFDDVTSLDGFMNDPNPGSNGFSDAIAKKLADIQIATKDLATQLEDVGLPDTEKGRQTEDRVRESIASVEKRVKTAERAIARAKKGGVLAIVTAVATIVTQISEVRTEVEDAVKELSDIDAGGEISRAFESSAACKDLRSAVGG
ncbi:MAG: hypothetical protein EXQ69_00050 [Acidimicrobiia bacterium]|nr:hypothetical protein [Acidimicrobiia bacterium]